MFGLMIVFAAAQAVSLAAPSDTVRPEAVKPKVICTSEKIVGSTIPRRICRTSQQRSAERSISQEALDSQRDYSRAQRN